MTDPRKVGGQSTSPKEGCVRPSRVVSRALHPPVRVRLAFVNGGLFTVAGSVLLLGDYLLVRRNLLRIPESGLGEAPVPVPAPMPSGAPIPTVHAQLAEAVSTYESRVLSTLLTQSLIGLIATAALAGVLGWWTARRALRPVHAITATARRLSAEDLGQRIALGGSDDEIGELADTFDDMLDRLAAAFEAQRRFVANASHELRTPLALQRTLIDVALEDPAITGDGRVLAEQLLVANRRSEALIHSLLMLARSTSGAHLHEPVRLDLLVREALRDAEPALATARITAVAALAARTVYGDPILLGQLVRNLIDNAVKYNVADGWVRVDVGAHPALKVGNSGMHVPREAVPLLFEPFKRLAPDRTDLRGSGLGLSIVQAIATAHGGTCTAEPTDSGGLTVTVEFPVP